jgi:hypothetical protein|tara:strand:+ start:520 stop:798 length:279 start_codon:yes stop_codon:yes gene_type:complete
MSKVYGLKIYTRTTHARNNGVYNPKMLGVIEGPVNKMIKAYPKEFSFMRHETKRSIRPSAINKKERKNKNGERKKEKGKEKENIFKREDNAL